VDVILNGPYNLKLHSMGCVDGNNKVNFYDGKVRVVDTKEKNYTNIHRQSILIMWLNTLNMELS